MQNPTNYSFWTAKKFNFNLESHSIPLIPLITFHSLQILNGNFSFCVSHVVFPTENDICCIMWNIPLWSKYISSPSTHMSKGYLYETMPRDWPNVIIKFKLINLLKTTWAILVGWKEKEVDIVKVDYVIPLSHCWCFSINFTSHLIILKLFLSFSLFLTSRSHHPFLYCFSPFNWGIQLRVIQFIVSVRFCVPFFILSRLFFQFFFRLQLRREKKIVANW